MSRVDNRQKFLDMFTLDFDFELKEKDEHTTYKVLHKKCNTVSIVNYNDFLKHKNCSNKQCILEKRNQTRIDKYGSLENYAKQMTLNVKKTKKEKYGNEDYNNSDKGIRQKFLNLFENNIYHYESNEINGGNYILLCQNKDKNNHEYVLKHEPCQTEFSVSYFNFLDRGDRCPTCGAEMSHKWYDSKTKEEKIIIANKKRDAWNNLPEESKEKRISAVNDWYRDNKIYVNTTKIEKTQQTRKTRIYDTQKPFDTYKQKTGFDHPMHNPIILKEFIGNNNLGANILRKRMYDSFLLFEYTSPLFTFEQYTGRIVSDLETDIIYKRYDWVCKQCNDPFQDYVSTQHKPLCPKCFPILSGKSKGELEVLDFVKQYIPDTNEKNFYEKNINNKTVKKYQLDICIENKNFGIEYNGLYHHSEGSGGKTMNYHIDKTKYIKNHNIEIISIYDIEWKYKQEIIKSMILYKLGMITNKINGRDCQIKLVDKQQSQTFLINNHIQGNDKSSIRLGLYHRDELVSIMTFSKPRFNKNYDWELTRFCNKINSSVIGAFTKLLKNFRKNKSGSIISYADLRFGTGKVYETNGFRLISVGHPQYHYTKDYKILENRMTYNKKTIKQKFPQSFDPNLTEWQNMQLLGYDRVWDCGSLTFVMD
jgi:hypothetical protein